MLSLQQITCIASGLIVFILLLRRLFSRKLPVDCMEWLWYLAGIRLCLPIAFPSSFSVYQFLPQAKYTLVSLDQTATFIANPLVPHHILWILWGIGCACSFIYLLFSYLRFSMLCRTATKQTVALPFAFRRAVTVRTHRLVKTPLTFGIFRPVILFPEDTDFSNTDTLPYILAHECIHIRRWDCLKKLLLQGIRCLHWFNPLVWRMCHAANQDLERACDLAVLRTLPDEQRAEYATTLLTLVQASRHSALCSAFGKTYLEERIYAIMTYKKRSFGSIFVTLLIICATASAFATTAPAPSLAANTTISVLEENPAFKIITPAYTTAIPVIEVEKNNSLASITTITSSDAPALLAEIAKDGTQILHLQADTSTPLQKIVLVPNT